MATTLDRTTGQVAIRAGIDHCTDPDCGERFDRDEEIALCIDPRNGQPRPTCLGCGGTDEP